ncbi:MAG TPA: prolyl oligopeptidase family serine peptidase [Vicinamibacteria bacterium]|nr:prolyl oligopeptidase family serine peptidase [Vicinamibacteria bacterium]
MSKRARLSCAVFLLAAAVGSAQDLTLEQLLSSPFPTSLVAAPNHRVFAWVENDEGRRNVWVASGPDYQARAVTRFEEDDGQEIAELAIGPGGNHVLFVRGGGPNRDGEIPNPQSNPTGAERSLFIVAVDGSESPRKLTEGFGPVFTPDGRTIAFLKDHRIWTVPSVGKGEPEELARTRGEPESLRWASDGKRLAFVSDRGDHSFVGVYDFASQTIAYVDPGLGRDRDPVWSPDGQKLAFVRVPNERQILPFSPRREALPWSIRVFDIAANRGREVFKADEGRGSAFRGVAADNQILWAAGDRIVFPWEREGWTHLYSVPVNGGRPTHLTPGDFEVEHVTLAPDGRELFYSSNAGDIDRRHLWRVSVEGGAPQAVTSGKGIEWSPVVAGDGSALAYLASDARRPAHAMIKAGEAAPRALAPSRPFPSEALVEPEPVTFSGADGMKIHGQLFVPPRGSGERHPAVVFFHGGSRRQMLLGWHYMGYYHNAYALNQYLASRGFVVLSVNYRSGIGYGLDFREALEYGAQGASEFQDVLGAGLYLRSRDDVAPDRIGLWGGSYGGYLTALGLARASDLFAAGVDLHGVHDWNAVIRNFVPSYDATKREAFARLAFESSPMAHIEGWRSPVLLIHGDDDRNVPFSESVDLAEVLSQHGVDYEQLVFPDEVHGFLLHHNWLAAFRAAANFLERKLMGSAPTTNE